MALFNTHSSLDRQMLSVLARGSSSHSVLLSIDEFSECDCKSDTKISLLKQSSFYK